MNLAVFFTLLFVIFGLEKGQAYNANERYQLLRDKINLSSLHGPLIDEDFFFSLSFVNSSNLKALLEEVSSLKDEPAAKTFFKNNDQTEKILGVNIDVNAPLPRFGKLVSSLFLEAQGDYFQGILNTDLDCDSISLMIPEGLPTEIKDAFTCSYFKSLAPGSDLIANMSGISASLKAAWSGKYYSPSDPTTPNLYLYMEGLGRLGLNFKYLLRDFLKLKLRFYVSPKSQSSVLLSSGSLSNFDAGLFTPQTKIDLKLDFSSEYEIKNWLFGGTFTNFEVLNLSSISKSQNAGLKSSPLVHFYGRYFGSFQGMQISHFSGIHLRTLYKAIEGIYFGSEIKFRLFKDRLGLLVRGRFDKDFYSIGIGVKSLFVDLNVRAHYPLRVKSNGIRPSALYNFNLRLHF